MARDRFDDDGTAWIDFPGPPRTVRTVSFGDVLEGRVPAATLRDKVVVVGATAPVLKDVFPTSTASEDLMAGPEVQAAAIQTVLDDFPLRGAPGWLDGLLIVVLGLAGALGDRAAEPAARRDLRARRGGAVPRRRAAAFGAGLIVSVLYPLAALVLGVVGALGVSVAVGAFERERVRDMFARFVPEAVVDDVLARVDDELRLGGERRIVTVLFSDIRGFTSYSEDRTPGGGHRGPQPLPDGHERRHPRPRRDADRLHGRRDHGDVRRADRAGRPRRPRAGGGAGDGRPGARGGQRLAARARRRRTSRSASG